MTLRRAALALGLATAAWCALGLAVPATRSAQTTADEPQYLLSALSLWEDRDLDIGDELEDRRWRAFHRGAPLPEQTAARDDGRRLSPHDPLLPLLLAVPVGLGGWVGAKLALAAVAGALAASLLVTAVRRLAVPLPTATAAVACFALAAPLAVYGTQVYPELPAALAVSLVLGASGHRGRGQTRRERWGGWLGVVALPWLSVKYVPVAAALAGVLLVRAWRRGERREVLGAAAALAIAGVVYAVGHLALYDGLTAYAAGDHFTGGELTVVGESPDHAGRSRRLLGLLVDRDFGLVAWQPAWLLAVPAVGALLRRRPPGWPALVLPLAAGWATATWVALTMHGWWWPGRQVVVVLPLAVLAVAWWAGRQPAVTRLLWAGTAVGAVTFAWLVASDATWVVDPFGHSPLAGLRRLLLPDLRSPGALDGARYAAWLVVVAALARLGYRSAGRDEDAPAGEGADADVAVVDADRHGAVR